MSNIRLMSDNHPEDDHQSDQPTVAGIAKLGMFMSEATEKLKSALDDSSDEEDEETKNEKVARVYTKELERLELEQSMADGICNILLCCC